MSEPYEARSPAAASLVQVPVDLVDFETRLVSIERRLLEHEARDQALLGVVESVGRLTQALGPLLEEVRARAPAASAPVPKLAAAPPQGIGPHGLAPVDAVSPDRLALAQARMREAAAPVRPQPLTTSRRSWLLRATRRMVAHDPEAAGLLVVALLPAHRLAGIETVPRIPGPPAKLARVLVRGRLGRRLGWEMAPLDCELSTVSALAGLIRMRASPTDLHGAGVRLDPPLALELAALSIDPRWTLGHRFTLAHRDTSTTCLQVRDGARPLVTSEAPAADVATTIRCPAGALFSLIAGEPGVAATVQGEPRPLALLQQWFERATSPR